MPKLLDKTCRNYMRLDKLSIINYKNIEAATLNLSAKLNCFIGYNGVGKTNLLDAVYYLSFCKSAFNSKRFGGYVP